MATPTKSQRIRIGMAFCFCLYLTQPEHFAHRNFDTNSMWFFSAIIFYSRHQQMCFENLFITWFFNVFFANDYFRLSSKSEPGKNEKITCLRVVDVQKKDRMKKWKQNTLMVDEINDWLKFIPMCLTSMRISIICVRFLFLMTEKIKQKVVSDSEFN